MLTSGYDFKFGNHLGEVVDVELLDKVFDNLFDSNKISTSFKCAMMSSLLNCIESRNSNRSVKYNHIFHTFTSIYWCLIINHDLYQTRNKVTPSIVEKQLRNFSISNQIKHDTEFSKLKPRFRVELVNLILKEYKRYAFEELFEDTLMEIYSFTHKDEYIHFNPNAFDYLLAKKQKIIEKNNQKWLECLYKTNPGRNRTFINKYLTEALELASDTKLLISDLYLNKDEYILENAQSLDIELVNNKYEITITSKTFDNEPLQVSNVEKIGQGAEFRIASNRYDIKDSFECDIEKVVHEFHPREWDCFLRHVLYGDETLEKLGKEYNVTRERIRQIVINAERKIKAMKKHFEPFYTCLKEKFAFVDVLPIEDLNKCFAFFSISSQNVITALKIINLIFNEHFFLLENQIYRVDVEKLDELLAKFSCQGSNITRLKLMEMVNIYGYRIPTVEGVISLLRQSKYILIDIAYEYIYIKDSKPTNIDLIKWILLNIGKPVHYSLILEEFKKITGDDEYSSRNILATLDRGEDAGIVRTFTGIYGLIELGATKHISAEEIAESILRDYGKPMHYSEIVSIAKQQTDAKENTIYAFLNTGDQFISNNDGVYALIEWKKRLDSTFQKKREFEKIIISHGYNGFSFYAIEFQISESVFKYNTLRFPINLPLNIKPEVKISDCNSEEYHLKFDIKYNCLNRIDIILKLKGIQTGELIWLELINEDTIRLFKATEYESYLEGKLTFEYEFENGYTESEHVDDILNVFFKDA